MGVAQEAGVDESKVTLTITSASVRIEFTIELPSKAQADIAVTNLQTKLADTSTASTFLSTPDLAIQVTQVGQVTSKVSKVEVLGLATGVVVAIIVASIAVV